MTEAVRGQRASGAAATVRGLAPRAALVFALASGAVAALAAPACGGSGSHTEPLDTQQLQCDTEPVDRFKELIVVEPEVVEDARGLNASNGPWSFRYLVERLTPAGASPSRFVGEWLEGFGRSSKVNLFTVPARPNASRALICPWLKATPANACNDDCSACQAREYDLSKAPFRLVGFTNRLDLYTSEDTGGAGESRILFAATAGPGDDPASAPLRMTVIFEYRNPDDQGREVTYWAKRWHALGRHAAYDEAFRADLQALYAEVTDTAPAEGGSWLHHVRSNEIDLDWLWDMREFELSGGALRLSTTSRTPDKSLNGSQDLARFVVNNRDSILQNRHQVPLSLEGGFARADGTRWFMPGVEEALRRSFAEQTCDGCHRSERGEAEVIDQNFHVSPLHRGRERVSRFLHDPDATQADELSKREADMRATLCEGL